MVVESAAVHVRAHSDEGEKNENHAGKPRTFFKALLCDEVTFRGNVCFQEDSKLYKAKEICCSLDVWGILINIILQDAPFFVFRVLLIAYYELISYMNIFFTCKNTLVITLQVRGPKSNFC